MTGNHTHPKDRSDKPAAREPAGEEEIKRRYFELQELEGQMKEVQSQIQMVEAQATELARIEQALDHIKEVKNGSRAFVSLSEGIFLPATVQDTQNVIINVGAGTFVQKRPEEVKTIVQSQRAQMEALREQLQQALNDFSIQARETHAYLAKALSIDPE